MSAQSQIPRSGSGIDQGTRGSAFFTDVIRLKLQPELLAEEPRKARLDAQLAVWETVFSRRPVHAEHRCVTIVRTIKESARAFEQIVRPENRLGASSL